MSKETDFASNNENTFFFLHFNLDLNSNSIKNYSKLVSAYEKLYIFNRSNFFTEIASDFGSIKTLGM